MPSIKPTIIARDCAELVQLIHASIDAEGLECNLNHIDVSHVTSMDSLFSRMPSFNGFIDQWDVSNVTNMSCMFQDCDFVGDISKWNVANVQDMRYMFLNSKFNGDLSAWNVGNVQYVQNMFYEAAFNGDISKWAISSDIELCTFMNPEKSGDFSIPNIYHWLLAVQDQEKTVTWPQAWKDHAKALKSAVQNIGSSETHEALLMQQSWLERNAQYLSKAESLNFDFSQDMG